MWLSVRCTFITAVLSSLVTWCENVAECLSRSENSCALHAYLECNICKTVHHHKIVPKLYGTLFFAQIFHEGSKNVKEISEDAVIILSAYSSNTGIGSSVLSSENLRTSEDVMSSSHVLVLHVKWQDFYWMSQTYFLFTIYDNIYTTQWNNISSN